MKKPSKTLSTMLGQEQNQEPQQDQQEEPLKDGSDVCQQLMDRYAKSSAPQHRHLVATAAAMRSILASESLPLTPSAYFAAAIDSASFSDSQTLDATAVAALLSFLSIVVPLVPPQGIAAPKASEAVGVLVGLVGKEREGLAVASVRAAVKCLGVLLGFCDLEDWDSVKLGFETLLNFSVDRRPKVRRCAQDYLEKVFTSFKCSAVTKAASKLVLFLLKNHMPFAAKLSGLRAVDGSKDDKLMKPEHLEVLYMLDVVKISVPCLPEKVSSKIMSEIQKLMSSEFSVLTRHVHKIIEAFFETSRVEVVLPEMEKIVVSLASYVSLEDRNPLDTVMSAATFLKRALGVLHDRESSSWISNLPLVCGSIAGLLTSEASTASQASSILKELLSRHVDHKFLKDKPFDDELQESIEASAVKSICAVFENTLSALNGIPNEHILGVISVLFLKLEKLSYVFMKDIVLKLANLILANGSTSNTDHLRDCIGSAVIAMGPERILTLLPISLHDDFTCMNIWLIPILRDYVVGASLQYYMEHIVPLAKSFKRASHKVKKLAINQDLQAYAHDLWGLLPAFCRHPTDTYQNIGPLSETLIRFLKKDSFMHESIAVALQVLVSQNKSVLSTRTDAGESNSYAVKNYVLDSGNVPTYSKKTATKNIKALTSCSTELLMALTDLFVDSRPEKRSYLKDAIGCLASITDSSITKKILLSLFERFQFVDGEGDFEKMWSHNQALIDKEQGSLNSTEKDVQRRVILALASSFVEGAKEDLIDLIYKFIAHTFQVTNETVHREAYNTLSRILEEHALFSSSRFVELSALLLDLKSPVDIASLKSRFQCFHILMVHALKMSLEEENTKAFLFLNEIILTLKEGNEETRKAAYDMLLEISSSLRDSPGVSDPPYQKLITMIMGYFSGSSPQIKSGAVSALSVLVYKDADICLSMPDLVPSLLSLLHTKAVEVIKAVLGFVKVLVSCLQARDLRSLLSDIVNEVLRWSSVSRHHFRSKVSVIMEILIRKCGCAAVELVTPEKYKSFLKTVFENRRNKTSSKETGTGDMEMIHDYSSAEASDSMPEKKRKKFGSPSKENGSEEQRKTKREKKNNVRSSISNESHSSNVSGGALRSANRAKHFNNEKSMTGRSEGRQIKGNRNFNTGRKSGEKRKSVEQTNMGKKDEVAVHTPPNASKLRKHKKVCLILNDYWCYGRIEGFALHRCDWEGITIKTLVGRVYPLKLPTLPNRQNPLPLSLLLYRSSSMATIPYPALHKLTHVPEPTRPKSYSTRSKTLILCKKPKNDSAFKEKKQVLVDYDKGKHEVSTRVSGLRKADIPRRYRLRVQGDRSQKDWTVSEVVDKILKLDHRDDIDGLLNRWVGRFARKNFSVLIREITQTGSIQHSIQVFRWMKNQKNYCAQNDIYNMIIRLHARHNWTDQARGLFFEMQEWRCKADAETYNALINAHGRGGQWRWAMNIMEDMLHAAIPPSRSTYNNLINACGSSGNWREALKVCKKMTDNGVGPDLVTHNIVLSAYKNGAQYSKALSYFELMKGTHIRPDTTTLNIVIHCLVKLGQYAKAIDIFNSMREKRAECHPDIVTFTSIIHLYSVWGKIENCTAVFNTMLGEGLKPNIVSYNTLIAAYASHRMDKEALSVFNEIKQRGFSPDVVSYTSLLNAYGRSQKPKKAREVFDMIKRDNQKPNLVSYNALIDAYGSNGLLAEAVEALREMEQDGIQPNIVSICTLLAACGRCGQKVKIDAVLSASEQRGIELNTVAYNSAIGSYMNVGEYEKAINLYRLMRKKKVMPDCVTYTVLISGCCKMSNYTEALNFLDEMMYLKIPLSQEVYASVICAYSKQGQLGEAESLFNLMKMAGYCPDVVTYTAMLHAYNAAENWEKACALFQEMETNNFIPDTIACSALMRAFNKGGQPSKVLVLAEIMREKEIPFGDAIFFEMLSACSILRDWRTAVELIKLMEPSFAVVSAGVMNHLLHFLGKSGKTETMMKLFYKIVAAGTDVNFNTYSILLKNLLSAGNWRKYIEVTNRSTSVSSCNIVIIFFLPLCSKGMHPGLS
ncbi:hypothetical protein FH972_016809 [Carpinus fangiana]|uniref:Uncharacterized protein n=1 Tax=Carpinus fangiana TaxID=176857 RepID=A0A5N6RHA2_9ROSI|nr:hypothetical protein FH972_016809 [Carpinus fangiana]KAE8098772.1 hypothetical protein FH972_016809 [Carpinus fangiana]